MKAICNTTCEIDGSYYEKGWEGDLTLPEDHPSLEYFTLSVDGGDENPKDQTKAQIIEALKAKGVEFPSTATKAELQALLGSNQ